MALTDRDIIITPNKGASTEPTITFTGADASSSATITLRVLNAGATGTLSFEGTTGQLLSLTDTMSGTIFSVNDVSGMPSIEVLDTGEIRLAEFSGFVNIPNTANATTTANGALRIAGGASIVQDLRVGGTIYGNVSGTITSAATVGITNDPSNASTHYLAFVDGTSGNLPIKVDGSTLAYIPSTNRLGIGRTPSYSLDVAGQVSPLQTVARFGTAGQDVTITHSSPIISANAYYNGGWYRSGAGLASKIDLGPGSFDFQTSVTNAGAASSISDFVTRLHIANNGRIGINTNSPGAQLEVRDGDIWLNAPGGGDPAIRFVDDGGYGVAGFQIQYGNSTGNTIFDNVYNTNTAGMFFRTRTGGTPQNVMTLMNNRVGLTGVTNPSYAIDANITANYMRLDSGANYGGIMMYQNGAVRGYLGMAWNTNDYVTGSTQGDLTLRAESDLILAARSGNNASQLFLSSNTNAYIGVGTNTPNTAVHVYRNRGANYTEITDMLKLETYRDDFTSIGGSAIVFKNQDGNNGTNEARIKSVTENDGSLGINNEASSSFIFNMTNGGTAADRVMFRGDGRVGIGTMVPGELLDVNGVANIASHITQGPLVSRPNVTWGASGNSTGAVIIRFPGNTANYGMVHVVIDVYTYDGNHASTLIIGGHNWNGSWYNYGASVVGTFTKGIRLGVLGGQYTITLGNNGTSWSYGQVIVRKIQNGSYYSGIMDLSGTYTISQSASSDASYTWISAYLATSGAGSNINADLLDGIDSTQFLRSDTTDYQTGGTLYFNGGTLDTSTYDSYASMRVIRNSGGANNDGMFIGYANAGSAITRIYGGGATGGAFEKYSTYSYEPGSFRAPIFYDSNNTSYYADFANSTTSVNQLGNTVYNNYGRGPTGLYASTRYQLLFSMGSAYQLPADGTTTGNLYGIAWSHPNAGGIASNLADHGMLILQNGAFRGAWGGGSLRTTSDVRAPIYYDSNNTGYYADPASISSMYGVAIRGDSSSTDSGNQIFFWGSGDSTTSAIGFKANGGEFGNPTGNGDGYNTYLSMDTVGRGWVFRRSPGGSNFSAAYTSGWILNNGIWQANASMRAPLFYDSNNTNYYVDPASTSVLNVLNVTQLNVLGNAGVNGPSTYTWAISASATQARRFLIARIGIDYNDWNSVGGMEIEMHETYFGQGLIKKYTVYYGYVSNYGVHLTSYQGTGYNGFMIRTSGEVVVSGDQRYIEVYADVRYYTTATVIMKTTRRITTNSTPPVGYTYIYTNPVVTNIADFTADSATYQGSSIISGTDMRAPIFYDQNNTGYYVNPNSTSNIIRLDGDEINIDGGSRNNTYDATVYITATNNNDWGLVVNKNNGSASEYGVDIRMGSGHTYGLRVLGGGSEQARLSSDYFYHFSDIRTPIFYDSNNTGYYANMASAYSTNINGFTSYTKMRNGGTYKRNTARNDYTSDSNYWIGGDGWGTIDLNTIFDWGNVSWDSWSNPGNQPSGTSHWNGFNCMHYTNGAGTRYGWQMTMGAGSPGLLYVRGQWGSSPTSWYKVQLQDYNTGGGAVYASIYYDANDTAWYADPNGTSRFNALNLRGTLTFEDTGGANTDGAWIFFGDRGRRGTPNTNSTVYNYGVDGYGLFLESGYNGDSGFIKITDDGVILGGAADENLLVVWDEDTQTTRLYVDGVGNTISTNSMRAPIFYDSNNTSYYVNPASGTRLYGIFTNNGGHGDSRFVQRYTHSTADGNSQILIWCSEPGITYDNAGIGSNINQGGQYYGRDNNSNAYGVYMRFDVNAGYTEFWNTTGAAGTAGGQGTRRAFIGTSGDFYSNSEITAYYSDERLKDKVGNIDNALEKLLSIETLLYKNNKIAQEHGFENTNIQVGVSAQSVEKVLPEVIRLAPFDMETVDGKQVSKSGENYKTVQYDRMVPLLIEAIKEQQGIINKLAEEVDELKKEKSSTLMSFLKKILKKLF